MGKVMSGGVGTELSIIGANNGSNVGTVGGLFVCSVEVGVDR